jgi:hypothetical protein
MTLIGKDWTNGVHLYHNQKGTMIVLVFYGHDQVLASSSETSAKVTRLPEQQSKPTANLQVRKGTLSPPFRFSRLPESQSHQQPICSQEGDLVPAH